MALPSDKTPKKTPPRIFVRVTPAQRKTLDDAVEVLRESPDSAGNTVDLSSFVRSAALTRARKVLDAHAKRRK